MLRIAGLSNVGYTRNIPITISFEEWHVAIALDVHKYLGFIAHIVWSWSGPPSLGRTFDRHFDALSSSITKS